MSELVYNVALTLVPGVGDVLGKKLVNYCGSAEAVFREPTRMLQRIPRVGQVLAAAIGDREILKRAEAEVEFIRKYRIRAFFYTDPGYPSRLKNCIDGPVMVYYKGHGDLNVPKVIGMVGTRSATDYGKEVCRSLIEGLSDLKPLIVSGLAYGIDSCAHRTALEKGLPTVGVLGHGLDRIYPGSNRILAERMIMQGGLLTDFPSGTKPDRENFPRRNRIIAGMCDAIVVVEAARTGGALITAGIANSYSRDVFAAPGRIGDPFSEGANRLIRCNSAALVQSAEDIRYLMGWADQKVRPAPQRKIFIEMTPEEEKIVQALGASGPTGIDDLALLVQLSMSRVSAALLNLEFEGVVRSLPGKVYLLDG